MNCKYHPDREAEFFCSSCNAPLCSECAEQSATGEYYCYECAMLHSITELLPDYLSLREGEAAFLTRLTYRPDPQVGYRLSVTKPSSGEMNLILTPQGIEYSAPATEGA